MGIDKDLLAILACPLCKTAVREKEEKLVCDQCGRRYPLRDGIPVMLIDEAELPFASEADAAQKASPKDA